MDVVSQLLIALIGGFLSGGLIIGWIEIQRHRREKMEWQLRDKKIELRIISVATSEIRWKADDQKEEKEKLRIYETGLEGKIRGWSFVIKIAYSNLTDRDILATSLSLEIEQLNIEKPTAKKNYPNLNYYQRIIRYDLMNKNIIEDNEFPLVLLARTTSGIVYLGEWNFDYPNLLNNSPTTATFKILLEDGSFRNINIDFSKSTNINEIMYSTHGYMHWSPAYEKHKQEIEEKEENEEIPF